jgi:hypothetical protein
MSSPLTRLFWLGLISAALFVGALAYPHAPCWGILGLTVLLAWPIWADRAGRALFHRRLLLAGVALPQSTLRRWLWRGWLTQALAAVAALVLAALLLGFASLLRPEHWAALALDVLAVSLLAGPLRRWLARQVRAEHLEWVLRRWPLPALNLVVLAAAFLVIDFAVSGAPDTRGLAWSQVAERAFAEASVSAACPAAGWLRGLLASVETLSWHAAQRIVPGLPDPLLKLAVWLFVLARAGLLAWLFTLLLLGVLALLDQRDRRARGTGAAAGTASLAFIYTILLLAVPTLYATARLEDFDPSTLGEGGRQLAAWTNPCRFDPAREALVASLGAEVDTLRRRTLERADAAIADGLDDVFMPVEQGVEAYLDWYFSVVAEYQRLAAAAAGDIGALLADQLEQRLFGDNGFEQRLAALERRLAAATDAEIAAAADRLDLTLALDGRSDPCAVDALDLVIAADLTQDRLRATTAAGSGAAAAVTVKLLAEKTGTVVAAKVAGKKSFQTAAMVAGKLAAKKGGSALASAAGAAVLCAPSGPWVLLCGAGAGLLTWVTVDKALIEIDELRLRADMRTDLLQAIDQQRDLLAAALKAQQAARIDARLLRLRRDFVPMRDGL